MRLRDKVVVVTGAGGGMGRVAAEVFAREGAKIAVADVSVAGGEETVRAITGAGGDAFFVRANMASDADVKDLMDRTADRYGGLHVLYNNAGIMPNEDASVTGMTDETFSL